MRAAPPDPKQLERLRRLRARGPAPFILRRGVLGWGVPTAVLFSALMSWWEGEPFLGILPGALVTFGAGGVLFGWLIWRGVCRACDRPPAPPSSI
jgi:hypothetical protein